MGASTMYKVTSVTSNGKALRIVDGSATMDGAAGWKSDVSLSATGPDAEVFSRVPRVLNMEIQFTPDVTVDQIRNIRNARVVLEDKNSPRRQICPNCSFASMGTLGRGPVPLVLNVLEEPIWM